MTDSLSQYCPNCEAQANTIKDLKANKARLREALAENARLHNRLRNIRALATRHLYERGPNETLADIELFATVALQETGQ